jgi:hypothetical protein
LLALIPYEVEGRSSPPPHDRRGLLPLRRILLPVILLVASTGDADAPFINPDGSPYTGPLVSGSSYCTEGEGLLACSDGSWIMIATGERLEAAEVAALVQRALIEKGVKRTLDYHFCKPQQ